MGTDLTLLVLDPELGAVVCARWLGGSRTLETALEALARSPATSRVGLECWAPVAPAEARTIANASYADGATPEEVSRLEQRFPCARYVWMIVRDY